MIQYPGFNPIAFAIGPVKVHWYGIMYLLGFGVGWALARLRAAKPGSSWKPQDVDDLIFFAMLGVIAGGRIGYVLFYGLSFWRRICCIRSRSGTAGCPFTAACSA